MTLTSQEGTLLQAKKYTQNLKTSFESQMTLFFVKQLFFIAFLSTHKVSHS